MMHRQQNSQSSSSNEFAMYPSAAYHSSHSTLPSSTSLSSPSSASSVSSPTSYSLSSRSLSASSSPILLSVFTWSLMFLLISSCVNLTDARTLDGHPLSKRSFFDIQCKGVYDKSIFARLDRICEDCYNLFREPQLHMLCKQECFSTEYFMSCMQVLLLEDEKDRLQEMVEYLGRK